MLFEALDDIYIRVATEPEHGTCLEASVTSLFSGFLTDNKLCLACNSLKCTLINATFNL